MTLGYAFIRIEMEVYSKSDLENDSEEKLLEKLKDAWDYDQAEPLEVYGTLREIVPLSGFSFYVLDSITHIRSNEVLKFPLSYEPSVQSVFVGDPSKFSLKDYKSGDIAKARVTFSPPEEREKHNNPFDLMTTALDGLISIEQEGEVFDFSKSTLHFSQVNNDTYLEEYLYNLHLKKALKEIDRSANVKKAEVEIQFEQRKLEINKEIEELTKEEGLLKTNNDYIKSEIFNLESQRDKAVSELSEIRESVSNTQSILEKSKTEYFKLIENLEQNMASLNETIEQKSEALLQLGLIEQEDINNLLLRYDSSEVREGHSFEEVFNSNYANAIEYIQAYLWNKGIVYKQSVLKDYLALLMSNDLIVLAGDSGSGKTNLVKSFAKAVGGEAIIIPVKPNWTSAEDLLGYYNPLESSYLSTKFLDALIEAQKNPHIPYFICLDEMNLARVEYYFADFLSLLEERDEQPVIQLFSSTEGDVLASELSNFVSLGCV